jgi:hypothetical protein
MKAAASKLVLVTFRLPQRTADRLAAYSAQHGDLTEAVREALEARFHDLTVTLTRPPRIDGEQAIGELKYALNSQRLGIFPLRLVKKDRGSGPSLSAKSRITKKHSVKLNLVEHEMLQWSAAFFGQGVNDFIADAIKDRLSTRSGKLRRTHAGEFKKVVDATRLMIIRVERPAPRGKR